MKTVVVARKMNGNIGVKRRKDVVRRRKKNASSAVLVNAKIVSVSAAAILATATRALTASSVT